MNPLRRLFARPAPLPDLTVPALEPDPIYLDLAAMLATTPRGRHALPWTEKTRGIDESAAALEEAGVMAPPRGAHKAVQP